MTAPSNAPTPNQALTASDCGMLLPGDLIRKGHNVRTIADVAKRAVYVWGCEGKNHFRLDDLDAFTFIGRPDADGWVPWSGGENPVPGTRVDLRFESGRDDYGSRSESWIWSGGDGRQPDIIAFRLASPAPAAADDWEAPPSAPNAEMLALNARLLDNQAQAPAAACEHIEVGVSYGSGRAAGTCLQCKATLDEAALIDRNAPAAAGGEVEKLDRIVSIIHDTVRVSAHPWDIARKSSLTNTTEAAERILAALSQSGARMEGEN